MVKFVPGKISYQYIAVDDKNKPLYQYKITKINREVNSFLLLNKRVDTIELPPIDPRTADEQIDNDLLPYLGKPLTLHQQILLDKYLNGSLKIMNRCFEGVQKMALKFPCNYSVSIAGMRSGGLYMGAFNAKADVTFKLPQNMEIFKIKKYYSSNGTPIMEGENILVADKRLCRIKHFDTLKMNRYKQDVINCAYLIQISRDFKVEHYLSDDEQS